MAQKGQNTSKVQTVTLQRAKQQSADPTSTRKSYNSTNIANPGNIGKRNTSLKNIRPQ